MRLKDQNDPGAEEATKDIYKAEFHGGVLKDLCSPYSKQKVADVKAGLVRDFRAKGIADVLYELPQRVVCRCTTECQARVIDQWFLKYSDPDWKRLAHQATSRMAFYPEEARSWFDGIIDWFLDWPCARKTGLGTPLPWSPDWIVETLSDSTIYMAYYAVSKFVNAGLISADQLLPEVFDFIFYGTGNPDEVSKKAHVDRKVLEKIRQEFLYWYPVDLRNSGKDLVGNHLTFFIFHHVALFQEPFWPIAIGVNGFMLLEGKPIHKSSGNFIPIWKACEDFGADAVRCATLLAAEGMDDPDWRAENVRDIKSRLESFLHLVEEMAGSHYGAASNGHLENWLIGRISGKTRLVAEAVQQLKTRTALSAAIYDIWNDLRWYERRAEKPDSKTLKEFYSAWIRLLAPFAPHMAEEAWRTMGEKAFVSTAEWPQFDESKLDERVDQLEELVKQTLVDTQEIVATTKISPKKVHYYTAAKWKWRVYTESLSRAESQPETLDGLIREMIAAKPPAPKDLPKFAGKIIKQIRTMPADLRNRRTRIGEIQERDALAEAQKFFARELKTEVQVHGEDDPELYDPKNRAKFAEPYRPAIFVE
jgi:leucyl-tRNA synthetase